MSRVANAWQRIMAWSREHQADALDHLRPPASDGSIAAAEAAMGVEFPDDLKSLYRLHDGSNADVPSVFDDGHWFMPLEQAVEHFATMSQFADEQPYEDFEGWRASIRAHIISVEGPVKPWVFSKLWIPLTSSNGDVHRYLDLDPAPGGQPGQVIEHYPEACSHKVLAGSLAEYLENHATALEGSRYRGDDGWLVDKNADDGASRGLPEWLEAESPGQSEPASSTSDEAVVFTGSMGMLAGTTGEVFFSMRLDNGKDHDFIATRKETKGFSSIRIEQRAEVQVEPCTGRAGFFGEPEFLVLRYKVIK